MKFKRCSQVKKTVAILHDHLVNEIIQLSCTELDLWELVVLNCFKVLLLCWFGFGVSR